MSSKLYLMSKAHLRKADMVVTTDDEVHEIVLQTETGEEIATLEFTPDEYEIMVQEGIRLYMLDAIWRAVKVEDEIFEKLDELAGFSSEEDSDAVRNLVLDIRKLIISRLGLNKG